MTKKTLDISVKSFSEYTLEGPIHKAIAWLKETAEEFGEDANIVMHVGGDDAYTSFYITQKREETDTEYQNRLRIEKTQAEYREIRERAQYEELKAKYGT